MDVEAGRVLRAGGLEFPLPAGRDDDLSTNN
jgi:hypothetical protein